MTVYAFYFLCEWNVGDVLLIRIKMEKAKTGRLNKKEKIKQLNKQTKSRNRIMSWLKVSSTGFKITLHSVTDSAKSP